MSAAFQHDAFQLNAFQIGLLEGFAFQQCAFQYGAFQVDTCGPPPPEVFRGPQVFSRPRTVSGRVYLSEDGVRASYIGAETFVRLAEDAVLERTFPSSYTARNTGNRIRVLVAPKRK